LMSTVRRCSRFSLTSLCPRLLFDRNAQELSVRIWQRKLRPPTFVAGTAG
jgi:hypothetical protein